MYITSCVETGGTTIDGGESPWKKSIRSVCKGGSLWSRLGAVVVYSSLKASKICVGSDTTMLLYDIKVVLVLLIVFIKLVNCIPYFFSIIFLIRKY